MREMRAAFASCASDLVAEDPRVALLSGDIGNRLFSPTSARISSHG